ncbi:MULTISPECIES: EAL domain-containing protein [unclassified Thioalkalivibrio]|uniref:EAL domain-containing protein n=1 Tax=unclassified Thioalkalivibrio TaxID=2621013 RepID=UPI00036DE306|nr:MULTISPECIES: EAL domain-containing protein [unclassified Thioalkalivibrio]
MASRRDKVLFAVFGVTVLGLLIPLLLLGWYLWQGSVVAEEQRLDELSQRLGEQTERAIIDTRDLLDKLNTIEATPCSTEHLNKLQNAAMSRPYIRAVGYWRAVERECGAGFVQGDALTPPQASRIYDSGVVAWWPGPSTKVGGVELFLMRYGQYDVAIDPRLLLTPGLLEDQKVGLWVESMPMVAHPSGAVLPNYHAFEPGLTVDRAEQRVVSRTSLGTLFPIDIIAVQPMAQFWQRYLPTLAGVGSLGLTLVGLWLFLILRYFRHQLSLASELREAIAHDQLQVVFQPIVDLETGACQGAEALARWRRENHETIGPDVFVSLAEETEQGTDLTLAILRCVLRELGPQLRDRPDCPVNLNITGQDLASTRFSEALERELENARVPACAIKLEITERSLLNTDDVRQRIKALRTRGHRIAIDDFGTGYSSLSYLESFELDTLKIDKTFADAIGHEAVTSNIISHIIVMARSLKLNIVAEGIESGHQVEWLRQQGVGFGQGYRFSRPLTADAFRNWCQQSGESK